jgi:hypothetical protein
MVKHRHNSYTKIWVSINVYRQIGLLYTNHGVIKGAALLGKNDPEGAQAS